MSSLEPRVVWPNVKKPVLIERDLVFVQPKGSEFEKRFLVDVPLEVLVNGSLYLVVRDSEGLRSGQVLSRNFRLTEDSGGSRIDPSTHHFIRYDGVNDARRGLGRLYGAYTKAEVPRLRGWKNKLDWMLQTSWSLHKMSEEDKAMFVWVAEQLVGENSRVRNTEKVSAVKRTRKAGSRTDRIGRTNTGMIPLLCSAANRSLSRRTQAVRGIGRRMDWRAVVLEAYIDQLRDVCKSIRNASRQRLESPTVFGEKRTTGNVKIAAQRMRAYSDELSQLFARPFRRAFAHVAQDLRYAATIMDTAAETLEVSHMDVAASVLRRIYRSMLMLEYHWRLEEILVLVSDSHHRKVEISGTELVLVSEELAQIHAGLTSRDSFTGESLEEGFRNSILPRVVSNVHIARLALMHGAHDDQSKTTVAYKNIKDACAPF